MNHLGEKTKTFKVRDIVQMNWSYCFYTFTFRKPELTFSYEEILARLNKGASTEKGSDTKKNHLNGHWTCGHEEVSVLNNDCELALHVFLDTI